MSYQVFDTEMIGFAARIQASGARTFTIDYRHAGRQRRMTVGRWPAWNTVAARERAKDLQREIDAKTDLLSKEDMCRKLLYTVPIVGSRLTRSTEVVRARRVWSLVASSTLVVLPRRLDITTGTKVESKYLL